MNRLNLSFCILLLLTTSGLQAQAWEPLNLAKKIFSKDSFPELKQFCTGEYEGLPRGRDLPDDAKLKFQLLEQGTATAVVTMQIIDTAGIGLDTYLHFKLDTVWKLCALRALAMTGFIGQLEEELGNMSSKEVDDIINNAKKNKKYDGLPFTSRDEYNFLLGNARLTLELDDNIIRHFVTNKDAFIQLKDQALAELASLDTNQDRVLKLLTAKESDYKRLFINSISVNDYGRANIINFSIGGMLDNEVGYLFVKDKKDLPAMSPDRFIMIRGIGDGWYLYKTT